MGSEGNKLNDDTTYRQLEPKLCANGCGFFGTAATRDLCSKCYRDMRVKEEQAVSAKTTINKCRLGKQVATVLTEDNENYNFGTLQISESAATAEAPQAGIEQVPRNRCSSCRKKVGLIGFKCKCGAVFCGTHRYPEIHGCPCSADNKLSGKNAIAGANPLIKADK